MDESGVLYIEKRNKHRCKNSGAWLLILASAQELKASLVSMVNFRLDLFSKLR